MKNWKRITAAVLLVTLVVSLLSGCGSDEKGTKRNETGAVVDAVNVVSLNMLVSEPANSSYTYNYYGTDMQTDDDYTFERRLEYIKAMGKYANPDVLLLQEVSGPYFWGTVLNLKTTKIKGVYDSEGLPEYTFVNHGNRRGILYEDNNASSDAFASHNFVAFDHSKFEYISSGTRFVSADGTRTNSWTDNASSGYFNDLGDYTWVVLKEKETGFVSIYVSTHVYTQNFQRQAYVLQNVQYMTEFLETVAAENGDAPVVVGGDFNLDPKVTNFQFAYDHFTKTANYLTADFEGNASGTNRNLGNTRNGGNTIDHIFMNGGEPKHFEVLDGQVGMNASNEWQYYPETTFDGTMYDISDHCPVYTKIEFKENSKYLAADPADYYNNPITADDEIVEESKGTKFDGSVLKFDATDILAAVKTGDCFWANIVEDEEDGKVLRIVACEETNKINAEIDFQAIVGDIDISKYRKMTIKYKTELSIIGCELDMTVDVGTGGMSSMTPITNTYSEWKELTLRKGTNEGIIGKITLEGSLATTGILKGDAIYISSIVLE